MAQGDRDLPQRPIAVLRTIYSIDTLFGIFLASECYINTDRLLVLRILLGFAHNNLQDLAILPKVVVAAQSLKQFIFAYGGRQAGNVYEVLLDDTEAGKVLPTERVGLSLLRFLLPYLRILLGLLCDKLLVLCHPVPCQKGSEKGRS